MYKAGYWGELLGALSSGFMNKSDALKSQLSKVEKKYGNTSSIDFIKKSFLGESSAKNDFTTRPHNFIKNWIKTTSFDMHQAPATGMGFIL